MKGHIPFIKMQGLGNDFVIIDCRQASFSFLSADIQKICDRHFGIGCDQFITIEPSSKADIFVRFYNSDGSESGACGNGTRCVALLCEASSIETTSGILDIEILQDCVQVNMGTPKEFMSEFILDGMEELPNPAIVNVGNPHCVFFINELDKMNIETLGKNVEHHPAFPDRTNVEFVEIYDRKSLRLITWERGSGRTLACGSGACAAAFAAYKKGLCYNDINVDLDGGRLSIRIGESDTIFMTGPGKKVFEGIYIT